MSPQLRAASPDFSDRYHHFTGRCNIPSGNMPTKRENCLAGLSEYTIRINKIKAFQFGISFAISTNTCPKQGMAIRSFCRKKRR
jgi:hypothetical protein